MRILIAEPNKSVADTIAMVLRTHGLKTSLAADGPAALEALQAYAYDAVLVSDRLDGAQPEGFIRKARLRHTNAPILVISRAAGTGCDATLAIEAGADDFIHPATPTREVLARLRAAVRRANRQTVARLEFGNLFIDLDNRCAWVGDDRLRATNMEYDILEALVIRRGRTVSREMLMDLVYGGMDEPDVKIIDVYIYKLRRKLALMGAPNMIETVWGRGYMFHTACVATAERQPMPANPAPLQAVA